MEEIITRKEAKAKGLKHYFTGKPCPSGHLSARFLCGACVQCKKVRDADRRKKNRDKIRAQKKAYCAANKDKVMEWRSNHYAANADKIKAKSASYYSKNKDKVRETMATYYAENRDKFKEYKLSRREDYASMARARCEALTDGYIAIALRLPVKKIPRELMDLKRQQLEAHRLERAINSVLKEISK